MTKEENCIYLLVKTVLASITEGKKLPKTMTTVRWVRNLKNKLTVRYCGYSIYVHDIHTNNGQSPVLAGELLDRAVNFMLIREISANGLMIRTDPCKLPSVYYTECMREVDWVLRQFLPSRFKNQGFTD